MYKIDIKNFYNEAIEQKKFDSEFLNELKALSTEEELKNFIEEKVQPIAKEMGYNFSTEEILDYEEQEAKKISEKQLENISGGVDVKNLALGGIISLMALGAGIIGATSSASADSGTPSAAASAAAMAATSESDTPAVAASAATKAASDEAVDYKDLEINFDIETTESGARLLIKRVPENGELRIPSKVRDATGKIHKVNSVGKSVEAKRWDLKNLKTVTFTGDFDDLIIEEYTFSDRELLEDVNFSGNIKNLTLRKYAFFKCNLKEIIIPKSIKFLTIGEYAFGSSKALERFYALNDMVYLHIAENAFIGCVKLCQFAITESLKQFELEDRAFFGCKKLKCITKLNESSRSTQTIKLLPQYYMRNY